MKMTILLLTGISILLACGGSGGGSLPETTTSLVSPATSTTEATTTTQEATATTMTTDTEDPYEIFLTNGGGEAWEAEVGGEMISREDAQLRALAGCDQEWAPGTIDYYLHEAYGHLCP